MTNLPESLKHSILVFQGARFDVRTIQLPAKEGKTIQRDAVIHPGAVIILPIIDEHTIVMIQNERFVVGETLWELPAGTLEEKEAPQLTAERELVEETGYQAAELTHLTSFFTSPGICNEEMHAYVAHGLTFVGQHLDDSERITVKHLSWQQALNMIQDGTIKDGKTIATLLYYHTYKNTPSE